MPLPKNWGNYKIVGDFTLPLTNLSDKAFWTYRTPTVKDSMDFAFRLEQIRQTRKTLGFDFMVEQICFSFKACGIADGNSPTEDPNDPSFIPYIPKGASADIVRELVKAMPELVLEDIWEGVSKVAPGWGPQDVKSDSVPEGDTVPKEQAN